MRVIREFCDICGQEIEKHKHFQIDIRWINGNPHYLDLCEKCKDEIGYKFNENNSKFFSEVLNRFRRDGD